MLPFKGHRPALAGQLLLAVLVLLVRAGGAHAGGYHWDHTQLRISGTPATTDVAGRSYSFTPIAAVPDRSTLIFSIQGKPAWASFDFTTGTLSGTPTVGNIGTFANIVITVSDGLTSVSLAPFSITVGSPPGSAMLAWTASTTT